MRVIFAGIGRPSGPERILRDEYVARLRALGRKQGVSGVEQIDLPPDRSKPPKQQEMEARALLSRLPDNAHIVALDERGRNYDSAKFAREFTKIRDRGAASLAFVVGGASGHGAELLERAPLICALSPMTFPHRLAQILIAEQVYRAMTLLAGHPYHRA